jgi:hypothetical protein
MKQRYPKYVIAGWRMLISPNNWRPVEIYFRVVGHSIQLLGCDIFTDQKEYLGWVERDNINIEVQHAMKKWMLRKKNDWQRIHSDEGKSVR